jgi:hypothetical protein
MKLKEPQLHKAFFEHSHEDIIKDFIFNIQSLSEDDANEVLYFITMGLGDLTRNIGYLATINGYVKKMKIETDE